MKYFLLIALSALLSAILIFQAWQDSGTYDEVAHITAGYTYVYQNDFRLYPDNPPLIKMITVLPWIPIVNSINFPSTSKYWTDPKNIDQWSLGREFLYQSGNNADLLIFLSRLPIIGITIALGILVFSMANHFYGSKAGLFSFVLFVLSPDIRAHGHLATTDVGATFFALLAAYIFYKSLSRKILDKKFWSYILVSGFIFALALLSKYSMIFLFFACIALTLVYIVIKMVKKTKNENNNYSINLIKAIIVLISITFISIWIISFAIGYTNTTFSYKNVQLIKSANTAFKDRVVWKVIQGAPLPYYYKVGLETMYTRNILTQPTYLYGVVVGQGGWKIFFPVSYILKTPIPILILLTLSITVLTVLQKWKKLLPFFLGMSFFLIIVFIGNLTIGTRFYYPSTVLFIITSSYILSYVLDLENKIKKIYLGVIYVLLLWLIITNILSFPYDISYVNELGGTTQNGYNALVDSSYDWGQDLKRFSKWYKEAANGKSIKMSYLGTADPTYYGIKYSPLKYEDLKNPHGLIALSITNIKLGGTFTEDRHKNIIYNDEIVEKIKNKKPITRIGTTIFVYDFD